MGYAKLFAAILTSTIWLEPPATVKLFITMLLLADRHGVVDGTVPGLAHAAHISLEECRAAMETLESEDPDSRTWTEACRGRRIERIPGAGWLLLNHAAYREKQGASSDGTNAERQQRWRDRQKQQQPDEITVSEPLRNVTTVSRASRNVTPAYAVVVEEEEAENVAASTPAHSALDAFLAAHDFGRYRDSVEGLVRSSRSPVAVLAELENHLSGEMGYPKTEPLLVAHAVVQYMASGERELKGAYFAGFVRRARGRAAQVRAEARGQVEQAQTATRKVEEQETEGYVARFARERPERYAAVLAMSEAAVDKKAFGRQLLVRAKLSDLVRAELEGAAARPAIVDPWGADAASS